MKLSDLDEYRQYPIWVRVLIGLTLVIFALFAILVAAYLLYLIVAIVASAIGPMRCR